MYNLQIVLTVAEHHSAIVPWQFVAQRTGAILKFVTLNQEEVPDVEKLREMLSQRTKLLVLHHVSNVLGECICLIFMVQEFVENSSMVLKGLRCALKNDMFCLYVKIDSLPPMSYSWSVNFSV